MRPAFVEEAEPAADVEACGVAALEDPATDLGEGVATDLGGGCKAGMDARSLIFSAGESSDTGTGN